MKRFHYIIAAAVLLLPSAHGNPTHPTVSEGTATFSTHGSDLTIKTSNGAFLNWGTFDIGANETTRFIEPSASSLVWNRINDPNPSQILGHLDANGYVILQNQSGFYVGGAAAIRASGVVMTTAPITPLDLSSGGSWQFTAPPPTASIINYGRISTGAGGSVYLIAHDIENHGTITAPSGNIGLYADGQVLVSRRPDGRGLSAEVNLPQGSVDNSGKLIADAGTIALHARVVNQGGMIQANSVRAHDGVIDIVASDSLTLGSSSVIQANGGAQGPSSGGKVTLKSGNTYQDESSSKIEVKGGTQGGNGGVVEISALVLPAINSIIDGHAVAGSKGGRLLIDPTDIKIGNTGTGSIGSGTVNAGDPPGTLNLNVNTAFLGFSQIDLQATHDITISDGTTWDLAQSTGISSPGCQLTLEAGNNINIGTSRGANLFGDAGWSIILEAGRNFTVGNTVVAGQPGTAASGTVNSGVGSIILSGTGTVQTQDGSITALAGNSITIGTGAIRTMNGGNIDAKALAGNINTGQNTKGYLFGASGVTVSGSLGGISTGAGGNVNINAGGDVTSYLPSGNSTSPTDAGSGAFGSAPGMVTVTAGGNVYGHFVAADSVQNGALVASTITAQNGDAGAQGNLLALSLATGGWTVSAPHGSIFLQEVRDPNGVLNGKSGAAKHLFDYNPDSFVDLDAGDAVNLEGTLLPRYTGDAVPILYPPILTINAGAGGITLGNNLTLFPSPDGELNVKTTDGGSFEGANFALTMSDSGAKAWTSSTDFSGDHAAVPVQFNNQNPVVFDISGNLDDVVLTMPKETEITVHGNMDNTSFSGQNLHSSDVSFIKVTGRIFNQNTYSFVTLPSPLPIPPPRYPGDTTQNYLQALSEAVLPGSNPSSANGGLLFPSLSLFYLPATHQLGYYGQMDTTTENQLSSGTFQVRTYLPNGKYNVDANGNYITKTETFNVSAAEIQSLYVASQNSIAQKNAPLGFQIGGPGLFDVTAQSVDLGVSGGINSVGPAINNSLATIAKSGATINLTVTDDLDMFSSQISSEFGGAVNINVGGSINAGLEDLPFGIPYVPHGIWTSGRNSSINIIAAGNIEVSGSRIAAFNGGNVFVESTGGNVDAGTGAFAEVKVNEVIVNSTTHAVSTPQQPIAGSGILTTTLPDSPISEQVGNITVLAPRGDINASLGGISQQPLNGNPSLTPTLTLTAGTRNADGSVLYAGNIDAGSSGVIGINTQLNAAGNISGLVIARGNSSINAAANVSGTFLSGGNSSFSAGGQISGIAIAGGAISVGSGQFSGVALSQSVSGGGAQSALQSTATASAGSQTSAAQETSSQKSETINATATTQEEELKKLAKRPLLAKYTGRVTVIFPPK